MSTSFQRKIHYLTLATMFLGGLGLLEGKWYLSAIGALFCVTSVALTAILLPSFLRSQKEHRWSNASFLIEFVFLLTLALIHVIPGHYPLSILLSLLAILPAIAWVLSRK
jgi:hypothetical protein